jgi:hypothetical protein
VNASHNRATLDALDAAVQQQIEATLRSEGGALHIDGSVASVTVTDSIMENNYAGRVRHWDSVLVLWAILWQGRRSDSTRGWLELRCVLIPELSA